MYTCTVKQLICTHPRFSNQVVDILNRWFTHVSSRVYFVTLSIRPPWDLVILSNQSTAYTLCSDQMFGSTVLLKMANISIASMDPHQRLVDQPNLQLYTLCTHVQCRGFESKQIIYFWVDMSQVGSNLRLSNYTPWDLVILTNHRRALSYVLRSDWSIRWLEKKRRRWIAICWSRPVVLTRAVIKMLVRIRHLPFLVVFHIFQTYEFVAEQAAILWNSSRMIKFLPCKIF